MPIPESEATSTLCFTMKPIGTVHNDLGPGRARPRGRSAQSTIVVWPEYADALLGIESCERLQILFVFDRAPAEAAPLQQHPMGDRSAPVRGAFALRSPHRPNPIGLTTVTLAHVEGNVLTVCGLDAWDGTPVLDIKPFSGR